jgi:hypothetical protein
MTNRCQSVNIEYKCWYALLIKWHTKIYRQFWLTDKKKYFLPLFHAADERKKKKTHDYRHEWIGWDGWSKQ